MKIRTVGYTKTNGDRSTRQVVVVAEPRKNYLMYDVTKFTDKELDVLKLALEQTEEFRDNAFADFEVITGIKRHSLWRSFVPQRGSISTNYSLPLKTTASWLPVSRLRNSF